MSDEPPALQVAIALVFRGERLLVTRRLAAAHLGGLWEFPGGKLKAGENARSCAAREVLEETGVVVRALSERPAIDWEYPERRVRLQPVNCEWVSGEGEARQVAELRWILTRELGTLEFPPANAALLAELSSERQR